MINAPCYKCEDRTQDCHSICEKYISWKAERDKRKESEREAELQEWRVTEYMVKRIKRR